MILRLIGFTLESEAILSDTYIPTEIGKTEGNPLSSLLSNFGLISIDKEFLLT